MLERIEVNGEVGATYLDCYLDMTQDKTVTVHCICGRGEACDKFKASGMSAGIFCEECEHFIEMTDNEAAEIVKRYESQHGINN